jgi:cytochrome c oxidase assembly factor CtaG
MLLDLSSSHSLLDCCLFLLLSLLPWRVVIVIVSPTRMWLILARIIAMFVIGAVLWFLFIGYEWKLAKYPIMPKRVLNRSLVSLRYVYR